jgi:hypothetical protein
MEPGAMAQRATGFAKRSSVEKIVRKDDAPRITPKAPAAPRVIPLNLAPLLSAYYRGHGRLSLRIERLPQLARLSRGRNNGDNSWSLSLDELDDLDYLPPHGADEAHTLALRIVDLDAGGGSTIAVLDFPVSLAPEALSAARDKTAARGDADAASNVNLRRLYDELANVKAALADRESELSETRKQVQQVAAEGSKQKTEVEWAAARAEWQAELNDRLAAVAAQAASDLERNRDTWRAEQDVRFAKLTKRAQERFADARERWQREAEDALSNAEKAWKSGEVGRIAAAEAQQKEKLAAAFSEAEARYEAAEAALSELRVRASTNAIAVRNRGDEIEIRRLNKELATVRATLADRETELVRATTANEKAHEHWRVESEAARSAAEKNWRAGEEARFAATQAQWQEHSAELLTKATARCERAEAALAKLRARADTDTVAARIRADEEVRGLRDECAAMQEILAARESALADLQLATKQARERRKDEIEAVLTNAKATWKSDEAARLAAAKAQWQEQSAGTLADVAARCERAEAVLAKMRARADADAVAARSRVDEELRGVRDECAAMQATLEARDLALAQERSATEQARERGRKEIEAALSRARTAWEAEEIERFAAAKAQWQEQSAGTLADVAARCERAEAVLAKMRAQADADAVAARARVDEELRGVREECAAMQATLEARDFALAHERSTTERARKRGQKEIEAALSRARTAWETEEAERLAASQAQWQERSAGTLADVVARCERAETALAEARARADADAVALCTRAEEEVGRLHKVCASMQTTIAARESALADLQLATEHARVLGKEELETALANANIAWKSDEAARFAAAKAEWRKQSASALADATTRYEEAEAALAQIRIKANETRDQGNESGVERLSHELAALHATLAHREAELAAARCATDPRGARLPEEKIVIRQNQEWNESDPIEQQRRTRANRRLIRDVAIAAFLATSAILFYSRIESLVPDDWRQKLAAMTNGHETEAGATHAPAPLPPSRHVVAQLEAAIFHAANVRVGPSGQAVVIAILPRGLKVTIVERHDSWTLVRFGGESSKSKPESGWVYSSFLKGTDPGSRLPSAPKQPASTQQ